MRLMTLVLLISLSACSTTSMPRAEHEQLSREYREAFVDFRESCLRQGRRVYIEARSLPPAAGMPRLGDRYFCT